MARKKTAERSPESIARANRLRLAAEEGARAMADAAKEAIVVRKNMERLRVLREAKEAEEMRTPIVLPKKKITIAAAPSQKGGATPSWQPTVGSGKKK